MKLCAGGVPVQHRIHNPKFDKINPANGLKRLFSTRGLGEALKATLKLFIFTGIAGMEIWNQRDQLAMLSWLGTTQGMVVLGTMAHTILTRIALVWLAIAGLDYFLQRKEMDKNLKMTKDEVRREMKESEGSPEIKSARMQRARQLARGGLKERVKDADVIVTNPTHYAVAIKYERSKMHAPMVVALGTDLVALRIREIAGELKIPIVENRPLARALHKQCDVGDYVPVSSSGPSPKSLLTSTSSSIAGPGNRRYSLGQRTDGHAENGC
ncbi:hypothetical protein CCB81_09750 [Armatimonadetes bacterium Uphvl-Ar2]|nr:hypothetical protein CCB81_09750 [Armatimonadetes bacterium Uphvl-Ar2]